MTAATKDRDTRRINGDRRSGPMASGVKAWGGTLACYNASGFLTKGATSTSLTCVGVFRETVDNSAGGDGAIAGDVEAGIFGPFANSTSTDLIDVTSIGKTCYIVDDQTVAKTTGSNTRSAAGFIHDVTAEGVWIRFL